MAELPISGFDHLSLTCRRHLKFAGLNSIFDNRPDPAGRLLLERRSFIFGKGPLRISGLARGREHQ
jgi:hypothetical protein